MRFYDEYGLLQPSEVDNYTGYRYYTDENIVECELIKLLKSVDFTLEEIALYKYNLNMEVLDKKQQEILEQIEMLKKKLKRLSIMKEEILNVYSKGNMEKESEKERVLRRKYERRNIKKSAWK